MLALNNFLIGVYHFFRKRRYMLLILLGIWALASLFCLSKLQFKEDINSVFPDDKEVQKANAILKNSPFLNRIYIVVKHKEGPNTTGKLEDVADLFEEKLLTYGSPFFAEIKNKIDDEKTENLINMVHNNIPYFMNDSDYVFMDSLLLKEQIHTTFESGYHQLLSPAGFVFKNIFVNDPLGITWRGMEKLKGLNINKKFTIQDGYLMSTDGKNLLIFLQPKSGAGETGKNKEMVKAIERSIQETLDELPGYEILYFGAPVVSAANASQIQRDILLTVGLAFILLNIMLLVYFRKWYTMPLLFTPVIFGTVTGLAVVTLIKGSISLIALGIGSVMMQLILDFAIHAYTHYHEKKDAEAMIRSIAALLLATAGTTSMSFLCLLALQSNLLNDLGLFAAVSIASSALFTILIFPQFLKNSKKSIPIKEKPQKHPKELKINKWVTRMIVWIVVVISISSLYFAGKVSFDANLDKFSYVPKPLLEAENYLDKISDFKLKNVYLIAEGNSYTEASLKNQQYIAKLDSLQRTGVIDGYTSINQLWPDEKERTHRLKKWQQFWTADKIQQLRENVQKEEALFHFKPHVFDGFINWISAPKIYSDQEAFHQMKQLVFEDLIQESEQGVKLISLIRIKEENKPALYASFSKKDFVFDNKFIFNKLLFILQQDFQLLSWLSTLLVFVVVLLTFRRIELAIATMIPMMLGWTLTLGFMAILDIRLNIFNLIICTFIFGLGMDYSIFYGRGLLDRYRNDNKDQASFRISIILSLITTLLGMGVLIFAKHPALKSIGTVSVIGLFSVTIITFFIQPVIFKFLLQEKKDKPRRLPLRPATVFTTFVYFGFYILNTLFMFIMVIVLVKSRIIPGGLKLYERLNSFMARVTLGFAFVVKRNFRSIHRSVFNKSAIIVANHQSSLDIVIVAMLSGKIRIVTKKWVFKLPVIGFIARTLQFYPSEQCNEPFFVEKAKKDLVAGYFILFFAEGTRSPDLCIHRFKKGAFLLAEQTGADILPLLIHGTGVSMPSGSALIGPGIMQLKMLPRITIDDKNYPTGYSARTKAINAMMRKEFYQFRKEIETPSFIKLGISPMFIYRSPEVRNAYKQMFVHKTALAALDREVGEKGHIGILHPNYGELAAYLHFRSAHREVTVVEHEEEKLNEINFLKHWNPGLTIVPSVENIHGIETWIIPFYRGGNMFTMLLELKDVKKLILFEPELTPEIPENWKINTREGLLILEKYEGI